MLSLLIVWPAVVVLLLLLGAQALLVSGARAHADAAASAALRAVWDQTASMGLGDQVDGVAETAGEGAVQHIDPAVLARAAHDSVASVAARGEGWRWWTPGASVVRSDWCHGGGDAHRRPAGGESGWVRIEVTGEVFGPFSALWPGRLDRVYASASGPAVLAASGAGNAPGPPEELAVC